MIILVQTIDNNNQQRYFSWGGAKLEVAFDILNEIISMGENLISIELIDKNRRVHLPTDISTEGDLLFAMEVRELEREWQQLLSVPIDK